MKALIKKDILTLMKQMKYVLIFFVAVALIFSRVSRDFLSGVLIIFSILPVSALAYDEQSKWDSLAMTMPYTDTQIVASKFVLGYIGGAFALFFSSIINVLIPYIFEKTIYTDTLITTLVGQMIMLIVMAAFLAFSFRFGVQKGKILFVILCAVSGALIPVVAFINIDENSSDPSKILSMINESDYLLPLVIFAIAVIVNVISIIISVHNYKTRKFIVK